MATRKYEGTRVIVTMTPQEIATIRCALKGFVKYMHTEAPTCASDARDEIGSWVIEAERLYADLGL